MSLFGNLFGLPVLVDELLAENEEIVFNAGTHMLTAKLRFVDFSGRCSRDWRASRCRSADSRGRHGGERVVIHARFSSRPLRSRVMFQPDQGVQVDRSGLTVRGVAVSHESEESAGNGRRETQTKLAYLRVACRAYGASPRPARAVFRGRRNVA